MNSPSRSLPCHKTSCKALQKHLHPYSLICTGKRTLEFLVTQLRSSSYIPRSSSQCANMQNLLSHNRNLCLPACGQTQRTRRVLAVRAVQAPAEVKSRTKLPLTHGIIFRQLFDGTSSTYTYLVACPKTLEAALIDPVLEQAERDVAVVDGLGLRLTTLLNTHCHADHITGTGKLKALKPGVRSCIAAASGAASDVQLQPDEVVQVGSLKIKCLATPGHTDGCMSFYMAPADEGQAGLLFSGDTLLIRSCGRTDFQQGDSGTLYDIIHNKLFTLPDDTIVYPGHDYQGRTASSIGEEKSLNPRLTKSREEFISIMANLNLPYPKQIQRALPANLKDGVDFPYA